MLWINLNMDILEFQIAPQLVFREGVGDTWVIRILHTAVSTWEMSWSPCTNSDDFWHRTGWVQGSLFQYELIPSNNSWYTVCSIACCKQIHNWLIRYLAEAKWDNSFSLFINKSGHTHIHTHTHTHTHIYICMHICYTVDVSKGWRNAYKVVINSVKWFCSEDKLAPRHKFTSSN